MSSYRNNYVPWTKSSSLGSGYSSLKSCGVDVAGTKSKYENSGTAGAGAAPATSAARASAYSTSSTRDRSASRDGGGAGPREPPPPATSKPAAKYSSPSAASRADLAARIKTVLERKDCPPVSYRGGTVPGAGARSRDPSPAAAEPTFTRTYTRSVSREPEPSTTRYGGSRAASREDLSRTPSARASRVDTLAPPASTATSRLRSSSAAGPASSTLPRYTASRHASREDLPAAASAKYINSRFLPRNSVEKSYTAYSKPLSSTTRSSTLEEKRRSRDNLLAALTATTTSSASKREERPLAVRTSLGSTPTVRREPEKVVEKKSVAAAEIKKPAVDIKTSAVEVKKPVVEVKKKEESEETESEEESEEESDKEEEVVMETVTVVTRGTSPAPPAQSAFVRSRRAELARVLQRDVRRPRRRAGAPPAGVDRAVQSDLRYTTATAPWHSYLDLKYTSPRSSASATGSASTGRYSTSGATSLETDTSLSERSSATELSSTSTSAPRDKAPSPSPAKSTKKSSSSSSESINSLSRNNSSKSISHKTKSKEIPKSKSSSASSLTNGELSKGRSGAGVSRETSGASKKQLPPPVPKADSPARSLATASASAQNKDFRKSVLNMNPEGRLTKKSPKRSSSVSSDSEPSSAGTATDSQINALTSLSTGSASAAGGVSRLPQRRSPSAGSESGASSPTPPPGSPRPRTEAEAKSFLMRALAPVTNFFKVRPVESGERGHWLDSSASGSDLVAEPGAAAAATQTDSSSEKPAAESKSQASKSLSKSASKSSLSAGKKRFVRHAESGERAWWLQEDAAGPGEPSRVQFEEGEPTWSAGHRLRRPDSGERAWWLASQPDVPQGVRRLDSEPEEEDGAPLGDRASPEGLETPEVRAPSPPPSPPRALRPAPPATLFISRHTNIDDVLGGSHQLLSPLMDRICAFMPPGEPTPPAAVPETQRSDVIDGCASPASGQGKLDDAALQLYKDGDYGAYLDLEASISEQQEEFEGFQNNKKNSIVLRTQLSVRVHTIIEKLLTSEGRELRRALFSLKQIFQEDKDLVHEFVQNDGLACLIKVGSEADQNYQNYILRALGQVMLYVDGMNGVMEHSATVQWLYSLVASRFRLVVKTALKLLLVFVEYTEANCLLLAAAVRAADAAQGRRAWSGVMRLLKDFGAADTELLIYAVTLVNKCLAGVPDQDTYYDLVDALEEQGMEGVVQRYMSRPGTDLDLLQQLQIYEAVLQHEDGAPVPPGALDAAVRQTLRARRAAPAADAADRRRSRRHSTGTAPPQAPAAPPAPTPNGRRPFYSLQDDEDESSSSHSSGPNDHALNGSYKENNKASDAGVTPALRRRRERAERQRSFIREQQESAALLRASLGLAEDADNGNYTNNNNNNNNNANNNMQSRLANGAAGRKDLTPLLNAVNKLDPADAKKPWVLQMVYGEEHEPAHEDDDEENTNENDRKLLLQLKRENTVKDLTQKLSGAVVHSPTEENRGNRIGDMSGLISKAKEGLAKSKSRADLARSPPRSPPRAPEAKKSESELRWEELAAALDRPLSLCDLDFTDLRSEDEQDVLAPAAAANGLPPPPPPPLGGRANAPAPPEPPRMPTLKKNKKTVKLFWKEVRDEPPRGPRAATAPRLIWDELSPVAIDTQKLEHLFESRAKDLITKKQQEMNKNKEIIVLDPKRSNAINIGMTKLPPPRSIKTAILKMDATIMNREGIEKLLTMLPTEEERTRIQDAQAASPELPLGSAEQFLLTLASISELPARLRLWAFKLDFENSEREIAEPLMDLKQGVELLRANRTFRGILSTLLSIGCFLNGAEVKGFQIEYLAKVPEVKDTVHKHSLLHHLCHIVMEKFPEATDLYSEIGAITRASKIDFDELALNIQRLEADCKASWDHLKLIAKHDGSTMMKVKMSDFLADCAERIILLGIVHRRVMNRYHKFLLWLGIPLHRVADSKPNEFCRVVSEFALEYRTTRERVLQQLEKKANHRERNKTRGKMITEVGKFRSKEDRADAELRQLLGSDLSDVESLQGTLPWRPRRRDPSSGTGALHQHLAAHNGHLTDDGDDEILESLVKTATKAPATRATPRERKRTRHADRKSLRRTLKNGLSEEEKKHIAAYIKGY